MKCLGTAIEIPIGISMPRNPSKDLRFLLVGRSSLQPRAAVSKARAAPNAQTGFQEERVNQPSAATPMGNLQFDHVERDGSPSSLTCAACTQAIATSYYEVNGSVTCQRCRNQIMAGGDLPSAGRRCCAADCLGHRPAGGGA